MAETNGSPEKADSLPESKGLHVVLRRRRRSRREGSLAAALAQSMALAVVGTAGAYPSWVLVSGRKTQFVLGAAWTVNRDAPAPGTLLLGRDGASLMVAIAFCCFFSVLSGSLALTLDFLGWRRWRSWAPLFHGTTALLIACAVVLGSCLLAVIRQRIHANKELQVDHLSTNPGQSLFLAFLACILAATATGLSCSSPALVEPPHTSWDFGRPEVTRFVPSCLRTEEFNTSVISLPLRGRFAENTECYDCTSHLERKLSSTEGPPEKRRRNEGGSRKQEEGGQGAIPGWESRRLAQDLEGETEEAICSSRP